MHNLHDRYVHVATYGKVQKLIRKMGSNFYQQMGQIWSICHPNGDKTV